MIRLNITATVKRGGGKMNYSFLHKLDTTCINHSIMFLAEP